MSVMDHITAVLIIAATLGLGYLVYRDATDAHLELERGAWICTRHATADARCTQYSRVSW